jgi:transposase
LEKANRKGDVFQCQKCGHQGHADQIAAQNQKSRYFDRKSSRQSKSKTAAGKKTKSAAMK